MNVKSKEKKENSTVELVIEVGQAEFETAVEAIYKKQRGSINVPGFRKGKAPRKIIEAMYGTGLFYEDAINEAYPAAYAEAVEQEGLDAVAYPDVEVVSVGKEGLTFKAIVTVKPVAKLGEYKGLTAPRDEVKVTAADVDAEMKPMIERATRLVSVERKAKKGDTAVIDFEGFLEGVPFEGGKGDAFSLDLGSNSFVPGFEDAVVGMKAGQEKDIDITFPEDYSPDLAGKAVVFKVKVNEIKEHVAPVLDDEFAKDVSEFDTLEAFKKDLSDKLTERREQQAKSEFGRALMDQLIENLEVELPDAMVEHRVDKMMDDYGVRLSGQGIKLADYLSMMGMTIADLRSQANEGAVHQLKSELALEAVAAAEKLKVSAKEKTAELERLAKEYGMEVEKVKVAIPDKDLGHDLLVQKAKEFVIDNAKVGKAPAKKAATKKTEENEPAEKKTPAKKTPEKKPAPQVEKKASAKKAPAKKTEE